jgi:hypothetical protein
MLHHFTDRTELRRLSRLNAQFIENYVNNDVEAHDRLLHPDFTYLNGSGGKVTRSAYLEAWASGFDPDAVTYWDLRDEEIVIHRDVALVSAANRYVEVRDGREHVAMAAYTDTYVLENDMWLCLRAQITPVVQAFWPGDEGILRIYLKGVLQPGSRFGVL